MSDTVWCPRRGESPLGKTWPGPDRREPDRWLPSGSDALVAYRAKRDAEQDAMVEADPSRHRMTYSPHDREWLGPGPLPRSCSYCGGIHPDDAIALIEAGWEVDATGKDYKRYLEPPGTGARHLAMRNALRAGVEPKMIPETVPSWSPVPVKLYVMHFSPTQVAQFNATLAAFLPRKP